MFICPQLQKHLDDAWCKMQTALVERIHRQADVDGEDGSISQIDSDTFCVNVLLESMDQMTNALNDDATIIGGQYHKVLV